MGETAIELQVLPADRQDTRQVDDPTQQAETLASDLAPVDKGRDAWLYVLSSLVLEISVWGFGFMYGVFQNYYASSPSSPFRDSSISAISAIGTTALAVPYMSGMILPAFMSRHPRYIRPMVWSAIAVCTGSFLLSSFANAVWQLIILQGVVVGLCSGIIYTPVIIWLYEWFVERRGLAGGLIQSGTGIGGAVFPPLIGLLLERLGFRWALRIWAIAFALFTGGAFWFMKPRLPVPTVRAARSAPLDLSYLRSPIWAVGVTIFVQSLAYFPVSLYLPTYTSLLGVPALDGQLVLSMFNLFSVVGQILIGWMCDRMPYSRVMFYSAVGSALTAYLLWGFGNSLGLLFAFAVLFGTMAGGFNSIVPPATSDIVGQSSTTSGSIFGSFAAVKGVGAIIGPIIAATLFDPTNGGTMSRFGSHGFGKVTLFVGGMMVAAAVFSVLSGVASHVRRRHLPGFEA
ncbi:MFS general substrate transporter [Calocera viscosa TUFC12733]|uniref:MFS general substrate transporter n=1 Tax=Calocera viscosa (strain TUFC12733) TaxID=1330018 RepID=A0A167JJK1_CALVF|nr:MFS general substrate transporter [Calocera viscosa TUFC12733]